MICEFTLAFVTSVCASFISDNQTVPMKSIQLDSCIKVAQESEAQGIDPSLSMAVAWIESRFITKRKSNKGAIGVMQILPKYWCPNKRNCNSIKFGIKALGFLLNRSSEKNALCQYASGKVCKKRTARYRYMKTVLKKRSVISNIMTRFCGDGC